MCGTDEAQVHLLHPSRESTTLPLQDAVCSAAGLHATYSTLASWHYPRSCRPGRWMECLRRTIRPRQHLACRYFGCVCGCGVWLCVCRAGQITFLDPEMGMNS